jgi:hypothetical protein
MGKYLIYRITYVKVFIVRIKSYKVTFQFAFNMFLSIIFVPRIITSFMAPFITFDGYF